MRVIQISLNFPMNYKYSECSQFGHDPLKVNSILVLLQFNISGFVLIAPELEYAFQVVRQKKLK